MKKVVVITGLLLAVGFVSHAQEVGVRFGMSTGGPAAFDAVFSTSEFSRVHLDASFGRNSLGVDLLWDFIYRPLGNEGLNWYAGVGPAFWLGNPVEVFAVGELGAEYRLPDVPISLSMDWRPTFLLIPVTGNAMDRFGFNVRYVF